jgi:hypothetical protein
MRVAQFNRLISEPLPVDRLERAKTEPPVSEVKKEEEHETNQVKAELPGPLAGVKGETREQRKKRKRTMRAKSALPGDAMVAETPVKKEEVDNRSLVLKESPRLSPETSAGRRRDRKLMHGLKKEAKGGKGKRMKKSNKEGQD